MNTETRYQYNTINYSSDFLGSFSTKREIEAAIIPWNTKAEWCESEEEANDLTKKFDGSL